MHRPSLLIFFVSVLISTRAFVMPPSQATLACMTCVATVKAMEPIILNEGDDVAKKQLNQLCYKEAPTPAAEASCEEYGDDAVDVIIYLVKIGVPPKTICQQLKKC
ncbi:unnamed protein product [Caenorhabditis nigoni]